MSNALLASASVENYRRQMKEWVWWSYNICERALIMHSHRGCEQQLWSSFRNPTRPLQIKLREHLKQLGLQHIPIPLSSTHILPLLPPCIQKQTNATLTCRNADHSSSIHSEHVNRM